MEHASPALQPALVNADPGQPGAALLQKPFGPGDLARRVRKLLDEP